MVVILGPQACHKRLTEEAPHVLRHLQLAAVVDIALADDFPKFVSMVPNAFNVDVFASRHKFDWAEPTAFSLLHARVHIHVLRHAQAERALNLALQSHAHTLVLLIVFVDDNEVSDFHDTFFGALEAVTAAGRNYEHDGVDTLVDRDLALTKSDGLYQDHVETDVLTQ